MTISNTVVSAAVSRLKSNDSHIECDIISGLFRESVDDAPLTPSNDVPKVLLRCWPTFEDFGVSFYAAFVRARQFYVENIIDNCLYLAHTTIGQ